MYANFTGLRQLYTCAMPSVVTRLRCVCVCVCVCASDDVCVSLCVYSFIVVFHYFCQDDQQKTAGTSYLATQEESGKSGQKTSDFKLILR